MDQKSSVKSKNKLLKFLPKAFSALTFQRHFTPNNGNRALKTHLNRGFSGPIGATIPAEAQRKIKNPSSLTTQEPNSPKISCMGQIKHKRKISKQKRLSLPKEMLLKKTEKSSSIRNVFRLAKRKSNGGAECRGANLGQMKRFASGRDSFANFDWTVQITPVESDGDGEDEDTIPLSANMAVMGGEVDLKPRQEINLWKRRTMAQPKPLKLNTMVL